MIWANLAMLGVGGAMLSVPVLIHFLMQPKPIEVNFPALRFLKEKQLINRSRTRIRHLLLLLLRCILIALLVLALAGPAVASQEFGKWLTFGGISFIAALLGIVLLMSLVSGSANRLLNGIFGTLLALALLMAGWYGLKLFDSEDGGQLLGDNGDPVAALLVLDTSPTMQYELENETRLKKAKSIAAWLVKQLPSGSQVCVAAPDGDRAFFSVDQDAASRRIEALATSYNSKTIPETLADAFPLIEESSLTRKEVYVVSDLTRKGWSPSADPAIDRLIQDETISLFVVDVGVDNPVDFRLGSLELSARQITSNGQLKVKAAVNRLGGAAQRNVQLSVEKLDKTRPVVSNGQTLFPEEKGWVRTNTVDVFENGSSKTEFQFQENLEPGTYHGKVEIVGGDPLAIDDDQFFTFEVSTPWRALVVRPAGTESRLLENVLAVGGSFEGEVLDQSELDGVTDFEKFDAIFLVDPGPMTDELWMALEDFVRGGGGLSVFLGHNASTRDGLPDPSFQTDAASRILTGRLSNIFRCPDRLLEPFVLSPQDYSHPVLSAFREVSTSIPWSKYPVFNFWGLDREFNEDFPTVNVASYNNFEPAIIERRIGAGRVLVMTTPVAEPVNLRKRKSWNQRSLEPWVWYVVVKSMTRYVVQADSDALEVRVGQVASLRNDLSQYPDSWNVFSPDPEKPPARIAMVNNAVSYGNTDTPGHYRLKGVLDGPVLRGFSANIDPKTVDLTRVVPEELDSVLGAGRYQLAKGQEEITRQQGQARKGREFYPLLMMMMFAAIVIEYLVSNRFYKS
ncbi:BatA domain-containing protein [Mariniblastus fucicola]|uniref:Aerotolerance regulator N-terminal domain-containing protein n=1 Tax=Mariniblastus fucicola TaxID=980251 RepID=A0A5B9P4Z5_9BACT|nr:BatA domain-containing protein [Mariniblastus fucicola]QEG21677.1 hypothetical protein MFFC18_15350 [Mariniblastus fucicola]